MVVLFKVIDVFLHIVSGENVKFAIGGVETVIPPTVPSVDAQAL